MLSVTCPKDIPAPCFMKLRIMIYSTSEAVPFALSPYPAIHGSIALLDETFGMLFAGDSVQKGNIYMFGDKRDINSYEASLKKLISLKPEYNTIFASHDEPSLPKDYATKVLKAWQSVENGEVTPEPVNLFGNEIMLYKTQYCGFYMAK